MNVGTRNSMPPITKYVIKIQIMLANNHINTLYRIIHFDVKNLFYQVVFYF